MITGAEGKLIGTATPDPGELRHEPVACVTVYVPPVVTVMEEVVAPVDHTKFVPVVDNTEFPQLFTTVTRGVEGVTAGEATAVPEVLVHPLTVCVTVYVPPVVTVMEEVVAPVDHDKLFPDVVNTELPQLLTTDTTGADGMETGAATADPTGLEHPLTV